MICENTDDNLGFGDLHLTREQASAMGRNLPPVIQGVVFRTRREALWQEAKTRFPPPPVSSDEPLIPLVNR
jgi:hypothetical protein